MRGSQSTVGFLLSLTGFAALARYLICHRGVFVLELHGVSAGLHPDLPPDLRPALTAVDLERALRWLGARFAFLDPAEALMGSRRGVLLTFDDGFANNHDVVLPLLEANRAPAVFFVATQHVSDRGRWLPWLAKRVEEQLGRAARVSPRLAADVFDGMTPQMVRRCARHPLVTIGSHTVSHPRLTALDDESLRFELRRSREYLEEVGGCSVDLLAYPFGDVDSRVARAAAEAGYRAAFAERLTRVANPVFAVPRVGLYAAQGWYLDMKLSGFHQRPLRVVVSR